MSRDTCSLEPHLKLSSNLFLRYKSNPFKNSILTLWVIFWSVEVDYCGKDNFIKVRGHGLDFELQVPAVIGISYKECVSSKKDLTAARGRNNCQ